MGIKKLGIAPAIASTASSAKLLGRLQHQSLEQRHGRRPLVIPPSKLVQISLEVLRRNESVRPAHAPLKLPPEALDRVRVLALPLHVELAVLHVAVLVPVGAIRELVIAPVLVRDDFRAPYHVLLDKGQHDLGPAVRGLLHTDTALALDGPQYRLLVLKLHGVVAAFPIERLVGLYLARERVFPLLHELPDLVAHSPRRFIGYARLPLDLHSRDAVLGRGEEEDHMEPSREAGGALLEDSAG